MDSLSNYTMGEYTLLSKDQTRKETEAQSYKKETLQETKREMLGPLVLGSKIYKMKQQCP